MYLINKVKNSADVVHHDPGVTAWYVSKGFSYVGVGVRDLVMLE